MTALIREHRKEDQTVKKRIAVMFAFALVLVLSCSYASTAEAASYSVWKTGVVRCSVLNVRASASVSGGLCGTLTEGQLVTLKGETKKNGIRWYIITYDSKRAYICAKYVGNAKCSYTLLTPKKYGKTTESLNVRSSPSTSSSVRTTFEKGHKMKLKGYVRKNGIKWYVMTYKGKTGYVAAEYIKKISESEYSGKASQEVQVSYGMTKVAVNIRKSASTSGKLLGTVSAGYTMVIDGQVTKSGVKWYRITYKGSTAYICAEYVRKISYDTYRKNSASSVPSYGMTTTGVNIRKGASTASAIIGGASKGYVMAIKGQTVKSGVKWYRISYNGGSAYICAEYVRAIDYATYKKYREDDSSSAGGGGRAAAEYALSFLGVPYVYGGSSLSSGVDCSGFTMAVYAHFGISLPHYDGDQEKYGTAVSYSNAKPGDLVFYGGHVGIYIGNGQIVHASSSYGKVVTGDATYRSIKCIRRLM